MVHILRSTSLWGGGGLPDTIMPTFRGGGGKKYPKMYYVVCERSLNDNFYPFLFFSYHSEWCGFKLEKPIWKMSDFARLKLIYFTLWNFYIRK